METDSGKKQHILIVEDDEDLAEGICLSLCSDELEFVRCGTVLEAKKQLAEMLGGGADG